jgi:hypothetical protein
VFEGARVSQPAPHAELDFEESRARSGSSIFRSNANNATKQLVSGRRFLQRTLIVDSHFAGHDFLI